MKEETRFPYKKVRQVLLFVIVLRLSFQAFKESGRWNIELLLETCREI